jgi:hypothetical protein
VSHDRGHVFIDLLATDHDIDAQKPIDSGQGRPVFGG